ncbi:DUF6907 domain-containing protein [Streptomyces microflavus]|uniref:Uncharacterized protein n=1 Tax=Streptomyces microflavus TaxID=1919 RepID=A0A7H8MGS0_STRMI|nr:hypothetical protein [Streptomyces microflavus]QKW41749.1 hypothetical protein HUT09_03800 [Streptomyces microflavus]
MRNTASTTSIPATFKPSGGIVTQPTAEAPQPATAPADILKRLTLGDVPTIPVAELLTGLGVTVIEVEPGELSSEGVAGYFRGRVGDAEIHVERDLPQADREPVIRELLSRISPVEQTHVVRNIEEPPPASPTSTEDLWATWQSMTVGETAHMPLDKLLTLLGVTVEEVEPKALQIGVHARFTGQIGDGEIWLSRSLPQAEREPIVRDFLNTITPEPATRTRGPVTARPVRQVTVQVDCYDWCTEAHHEHRGPIEDIIHASSYADLTLTGAANSDDDVLLLHARIGVDPFSALEAERKPHIVIDDDQGMHILPLMEAIEFADELAEFAAEIRRQAAKAAGQ